MDGGLGDPAGNFDEGEYQESHLAKKSASANMPNLGYLGHFANPENLDRGHNKYVGFAKLKGQIAAKGGVRDPGAVAAAIGRKKYGKTRFQKAATAGRKMGG